MENSYHEEKDALLKRLKRIEGQVKGIQKMIDSDRGCNEILIQIAAIRSAINNVGGLIMENHLKGCVKKSLMENPEEEVIDELIKTMIKFVK